jgi:hypothetical protein
MFGPPTDAFRGRRFASDGEVKSAVHTWLRSQPRIFLADGMRRLLNRYTMCVEIRGDYGDKWYAVLSSQIGVHAMIYRLLSLFVLFILPRIIRHRTANNLCSCHTVVQQPVTVKLNTMSETQLAASSRKQN